MTVHLVISLFTHSVVSGTQIFLKELRRCFLEARCAHSLSKYWRCKLLGNCLFNYKVRWYLEIQLYKCVLRGVSCVPYVRRKFDWACFLSIIFSVVCRGYTLIAISQNCNIVRKSVWNEPSDEISLFIHPLYFQSFLTRKLTIFRYTFIETQSTRTWSKNLCMKRMAIIPEYCDCMYICTRVALRMCMQTANFSYRRSFMRVSSIEIAKNSVCSYLPRISCKLLGHIFAFFSSRFCQSYDATTNVRFDVWYSQRRLYE